MPLLAQNDIVIYLSFRPLDRLKNKHNSSFIDQGFVYPGESLSLNMKRVNLPPSGMKFKWYLEKDGESGTLPSNMRVSPTGAVLTIAELRKEQEGILACAVYTNMDIFATKLRFLIKEINQTNNLLLFMATRPPVFSRHIRQESAHTEEYDEEDDMQHLPDRIRKKFKKISSREIHKRDNEDSEIAYLQQNMQNPLQNKDNPPGVILPDNLQQDLLLGNFSEDILTKTRNYETRNENIATRNVQNNPMNMQEPYSLQQDLPMQAAEELLNKGTNNKNPNSDQIAKNIQGLDSNKYPLNSVQPQEETRINDPEILLSLSTRTPRQIPQQSISGADHNTLRPIILQLEKPDGIKQIKSADRLSRLISKCTSDLQCSADATCIRQDPVENGFCRCTKGFQGNGIFCWEEIKARSSALAFRYRRSRSIERNLNLKESIWN
ncbi:EGF-like domain-containing protein [Caerostris darwini]|uniref:EGF-like domain-containing protein n=1 Tax=Caerostris darwini TaxID=1538125 RepID=A0AAV4TKK5_9ARAC|nr:EGF-like domain-containing protein [Caerostris darwini]